ncbi:hypothetical protein [Streptomyces noursei]|uniref:hypothetical protein n=1 Tax=Streptomyces noursei TaxID=1971 RepID=UPI0011AEF2D0|nr:hypothetical protein [Streptomyces noursei]
MITEHRHQAVVLSEPAPDRAFQALQARQRPLKCHLDFEQLHELRLPHLQLGPFLLQGFKLSAICRKASLMSLAVCAGRGLVHSQRQALLAALAQLWPCIELRQIEVSQWALYELEGLGCAAMYPQ